MIHVVSAITATGAFTLGGMTSATYLLKRRRGADAPQTGLWARVPSLDKLDLISYRIHAFGFPIWTFAVLITGPIWAHQAWSSYWSSSHRFSLMVRLSGQISTHFRNCFV